MCPYGCWRMKYDELMMNISNHPTFYGCTIQKHIFIKLVPKVSKVRYNPTGTYMHLYSASCVFPVCVPVCLLSPGLQSIKVNGFSIFTILDAVGMSEQKHCLPVVTAMINPDLGLPFAAWKKDGLFNGGLKNGKGARWGVWVFLVNP